MFGCKRAGSKTQKTHTASQRSEVMILSKCQLAFARATGTWHFCFASIYLSIFPNHLGTWDVEFAHFQRLERELGTTVYHLRILLIWRDLWRRSCTMCKRCGLTYTVCNMCVAQQTPFLQLFFFKSWWPNRFLVFSYIDFLIFLLETRIQTYPPSLFRAQTLVCRC